MSDEMWTMSEKLHSILIGCLGTEEAVLDFINWFFDGIRKNFGDSTASNSSQTSLNRNPSATVSSLNLPETCFQCKRKYTSEKWCRSCESVIFESSFNTWTSGNLALDRMIHQTQLDASSSSAFLRWIPFSQFKDVKEIGRGGFSTVYSARWNHDMLDGTLQQWVTNMEQQIIMDYVKCHDVFVNEADWNAIVEKFMGKMRRIFESRRILKCKPLESESASSISSRNNSLKTRKRNSIVKIKGLFRSLSFNRKRFSTISTASKASVTNLRIPTQMHRITRIPPTTSPVNSAAQKIIVLRRLHNSSNLSAEFIDQIKSYYLTTKKNDHFVPLYGITQDPESKDYYLVMQHANDGNLNRYLRHNYNTIDWWQRIIILGDIVRSLKELHDKDLVHHNLHSGNILRHFDQPNGSGIVKRARILLADAGLFFPAGVTLDHSSEVSEREIEKAAETTAHMENKVFGVLPYIAPEVLRGGQYTKAADIYSMGIIMWEITSGKRPYLERPYDRKLAIDICEGLRPEITSGTPDVYRELMEMCWDANPEKRPDIDQIVKITSSWHRVPTASNPSTGGSATGIRQHVNNSFEMFTPSRMKNIEIFAEAEKLRRQLSIGRRITGSNNSEDDTDGSGTISSGSNNIELSRVRRAPPESHMFSRRFEFEDLPTPRNTSKSVSNKYTLNSLIITTDPSEMVGERVDNETRMMEGIVGRDLVQAHQGSLSLDSAVGMSPIKDESF
ncbi:3411_t:CDS:2 [Acaulospora morrowiae]|uniref:3411_t:CDS:1 n=1 Tax=Acaulospora morrowiae TaxID=94023 RepID=A0A9N8VLX0_9GLOM|nr:3411_t:CDS:2 [Acaulospora morrowiae]